MTPTRGQIESVTDSQSGKTISVKIGGKFFSTKNWELRGMVGQTIEFVPDASEYNGKTIMWLNDYTPAGTAPPTAADAFNQAHAQRPSYQPAPVAQPGQGNPSYTPAPQPTGDPMRYLPMTSNLVAHAIAAGVITEPAHIAAWAKAAFSAAKNLIDPSTASITSSSPPEFDDDIPF